MLEGNHGWSVPREQNRHIPFKFGLWTMQVGPHGAILPLHIQCQVYNHYP